MEINSRVLGMVVLFIDQFYCFLLDKQPRLSIWSGIKSESLKPAYTEKQKWGAACLCIRDLKAASDSSKICRATRSSPARERGEWLSQSCTWCLITHHRSGEFCLQVLKWKIVVRVYSWSPEATGFTDAFCASRWKEVFLSWMKLNLMWWRNNGKE